MQATATNGLVQRVRQNLYGFGHLWHTLAFIQQRLRFHFHLAFQHRGRPPPRGCEKIFPASLPESFHIPLHRHRRYVKRPRNVRLTYRPIDHQLAGEIAKRRHVLLRMLKDGEVSIDVGHLPLAALEGNLRREQSGAFRKNRQLQLRHPLVLPAHGLLRKRSWGQLNFHSASKITGRDQEFCI